MGRHPRGLRKERKSRRPGGGFVPSKRSKKKKHHGGTGSQKHKADLGAGREPCRQKSNWWGFQRKRDCSSGNDPGLHAGGGKVKRRRKEAARDKRKMR